MKARFAMALISGVLVAALTPGVASAATSTINDAGTCATASGTFVAGECRWYGNAALVVAAADTVDLDMGAVAGNVSVEGTLNVGNSGYLWTAFEAVNNGSINVESGSTLLVYQGSFTNNGTITAACGATVSGTITGNQPVLTPCIVDTDKDGVNDPDDACPRGTTADHFFAYQADRYRLRKSGKLTSGRKDWKIFTLSDTAGCSARQIIKALHLGTDQTRKGLARPYLRAWVLAH